MLYALIVLYNKKCNDSITLQKLSNYDMIKIIIFDNSTQDLGNKEECSKRGYLYFGFRENIGLSKAYNYVISHVNIENEDFLIIFDDDTDINDQYISEIVEKTQNQNNSIIFLPVVKAGKNILSPSNIKFGCGSKTVKNVKYLKENSLTAINSGMVIRGSVFKIIRYNESLFLDCVDHDFMRQIRNHNIKICILNSIIKQNYSRNEKSELISALNRFEIFHADFKIYCRECNNMIFYYISLGKLLVKYTLNYRSLSFIKKCIC